MNNETPYTENFSVYGVFLDVHIILYVQVQLL